MKKRLLLCGLILIFLSFSSYSQKEPFSMCYFHLGSPQASHDLTKQLKKKLGKDKVQKIDEGNQSKKESNKEVLIKVFSLKKRERGKTAFKNMLDSGEHCDSLMISGHHTGEHWWGSSKRRLLLKDLEDFSCDKKYQDWFKNIKALWLNGCNTVTDKYLEPLRQESKPRKKTVDAESTRVADNKDNLNPKEMIILQHSYSASLDEHTPLSSRYLRIFPDTQIYGFNNAAPSTKQSMGREDFVLRHFIELGRTLKDEKNLHKHKNHILRALPALKTDDYCDEKIEAWEDINENTKAIENQDYEEVKKLGCDLIQAKQILNNPKSSKKEKEEAKKKILETLEIISSKDQNITSQDLKYSHLLFNNIYDTWNLVKKNPQSELFTKIKNKLKKSFTNTLKEKIQSPVLASLKKIDYLKFYTEIHGINIHKHQGGKVVFAKKTINKILKKIHSVYDELIDVRKGIKTEKVNRHLLAVSVLDQMAQYNLLSQSQINGLLNNMKLFRDGEKNIYLRQIKEGLKQKTLPPEKIINRVQTEINKKNYLPLQTASWDFFRTGNAERLNELLKIAQSDESQAKMINLINIQSQFYDTPEKQARKLADFITTKKSSPQLKEIILDSVISANPSEKGKWVFLLSKETRRNFFNIVTKNKNIDPRIKTWMEQNKHEFGIKK